MAIQAQWHDIVLESSTRRIRSIKSFDTEIGLDYERNDDTEGKPATQAVRRKLQTISLSYAALASLGIWPKADFEGWTYQLNRGTHAVLYINGESFQNREFIVKNVKMSSEVINQSGAIIYAEISVEMEEYAEEPSGLKVDKGFDINFSPGIREYQQNEVETALRMRASENDKELTVRSMTSGSSYAWY